MLDLLQRFAAGMMNRVRVNRTERDIRNGVPVFVKRRRAGGTVAIWFGNRFLALAQSGISMFVHADEWMDWEVYCSRLLYPDRPVATLGPGKSVGIAQASGTSLRQLVLHHETELRAIVAAARELRRVHQIECSYFRSAWSHGDMHLDNILYDPVTDRAILIDFDTRHESRVAKTRRHSDDLKVLLLDLISQPNETWLQLATAFLTEYRESSVLQELSRQLFVPRGFAKILWYTRTSCLPSRQTQQRMLCLQKAIDQVNSIAHP